MTPEGASEEKGRKVLAALFNSGSRARLVALLQSESPALSVVELRNLEELKEALSGKAGAEMPWLVFTDEPGALAWIKRNPAFHFSPVIFTSISAERALAAEAVSSGAFGSLLGGGGPEDLKAVLARREKIRLDRSELAELDQLFLEELIARIAVCREYFLSLNGPTLKRLYHAFHTIKGSARTLEFPVLSLFMHKAENFLSIVEKRSAFALPETLEIGQGIVRYLEKVADDIGSGVIIPEPDAALVSAIENFTGLPPESQAGAAPSLRPTRERAAVAAASGESPAALGNPSEEAPVAAPATGNQVVRVSSTRIEELEKGFRRIMALRLRLGRFAHQLKTEFYDERFPDDLVALVDELQNEGAGILELLSSLRTVPVSRLKAYAERVLFETTLQLDKVANLEFVCPSHLGMDPRIYECLELAVLHLIRNAVDHGLESIEIRARTGKDPVGRISIDVREFGSDKIMTIFEDDGAGINIAAIKEAAFRRGASIAGVLEKMKPQEIAQLVFSENFSSKEQPTEVSGRGIGLSAVKQQISELGGLIELYFEEGKGSRFTIILPKILRA